MKSCLLWDLNPHALKHQSLSLTSIPIPPSKQVKELILPSPGGYLFKDKKSPRKSTTRG